jgi:diadenosine tetraphosphatase ApaH/serine/threonine PP2A family protein phosphatase
LRFCIFSDVHGNLEALQAVLADAEREGGELVRIFLGDAVGYGPNPNECVELIRDVVEFSLIGNHDEAAISNTDISNFNPYAKSAILWTRETLSEENKELLRQLPYRVDRARYTFVHATPCQPDRWHYMFTLHDARVNFFCFETQVCFVGHSHQPLCIVKRRDGRVQVEQSSVIEIQPDCRYIINDGSVGQPRDGNPNAAYALFDTVKGTVELRRVEYDYSLTQKKMEESGLPTYLIHRLQYGH